MKILWTEYKLTRSEQPCLFSNAYNYSIYFSERHSQLLYGGLYLSRTSVVPQRVQGWVKDGSGSKN